MSNPAKRKGSAWELACARYLGLQRQYGAGRRHDVGDLAGDSLVAYESKALQAYDLATAVAEAEVEAVNAGKPFGVALVKRVRAPVEEGYVVLKMSTWKRLRERIT